MAKKFNKNLLLDRAMKAAINARPMPAAEAAELYRDETYSEVLRDHRLNNPGKQRPLPRRYVDR